MSDPANVLMLTLTLIAIVLLIFINVKAVLEKKRTLRVKILITCLLMGTALVMIFDAETFPGTINSSTGLASI
jgi:glucan phosphoethanolaminetransferase (alkaline phosphatase superfamily)